MTLQHFRAISENKQFRYLLLDGACIAERQIDGAQILLFQLGSAYVEVFLNSQGDEVLYTGSFEGTEKLDPYLSSVVLDTRLF